MSCSGEEDEARGSIRAGFDRESDSGADLTDQGICGKVRKVDYIYSVIKSCRKPDERHDRLCYVAGKNEMPII